MRLALALLTWLLLAPAVINAAAVRRTEVIDSVARLLEARYVDPAIGRRLAADLRRAPARWNAIDGEQAFAKAVTEWLRQHSADGHLSLDYSVKPIVQDEPASSSFADAEMDRYYGASVNHGVRRFEWLPGTIALLELTVFPPPAMASDMVASAMTLAAQGDALILDLRNNGGGMETVAQVAGYLLAPGSPMSGTYDRPSNRLTPQISPPSVPGRRFGETKPVFILTSKKTFSAAEALAYDLQALKRAVVVGERTGGGANPFEYRIVHPHFALSLPEQRSVNPITGTNWQGVGIKPDVEIAAESALAVATKLARDAIARRKAPERNSSAAGQPQPAPQRPADEHQDGDDG